MPRAYVPEMAYPRNFLRLVASGSLYEVEQFSWSLSLVDPSGEGDPPTSVPPAVAAAISVFHTAGMPGIFNVAKLKTIKLNEIGPNGRYTRPNTVYYDYPTPVPGPASTGLVPAQLAIAVSLTTAIKRGRAHAGRFYLPMPSVGPNVTGGISDGNVDTIATNARVLINAINTALNPYKVAVMSNIGEGTFQIVTGVRVGSVIDTIRSRRNKIPEVYQAKPIP